MAIDFTAQPKWTEEGNGHGAPQTVGGAPGSGSTALFHVPVPSTSYYMEVQVSLPDTPNPGTSDNILDLETEKTYRVQISEVV